MLVAAYGSLKAGFYNHGALDGAQLLGKSWVYGVMYWNGSYPKLYKVGEGPLGYEHAAEHELEIYDVEEEAYNRIKVMELGAGYTEEEVETEWGPAKIYYMPENRFYDGDQWIVAYTKTLFE